MAELDTRDAATEKLRAAIVDHARAFDLGDGDGEMLTEFIVVAYWASFTGGPGRYTMTGDSQDTPSHHSIGLLYRGIDLVTEPDEEFDDE